jgi:hypothetical protein
MPDTKKRRRRGKPDARVIVHNVYVGQDAASALANLARLAKRFDPDAFLLQESANLQGRRLKGYDTIECTDPGHHRDDGNNRVLVKSGQRIGGQEFVVRVRAPQWRGPKHGLLHPPRVFVGGPARAAVSGYRMNLLSVHRMPGGPTSRLQGGPANWKAEHAALVKFADDHDEAPLVLGADWNLRLTAKHPLNLQALAARIRGRLGVKGIDGVITRGFAGVRVRRLLRKYGSDQHRPVVVDLWFS